MKKTITILAIICLLVAWPAHAIGPGGIYGGGSSGSSWAGITAPTVAAAGDMVVGSAANALTVISKGANNSVFGVNNSGTLGYYTNIKTDDSAAQFYSATASKGTFKVLLTSMSDGILGTLTPVCTGACVLTTETYGAGTYTLADKTSTQTLTNKTLGGGSDDIKVVLRENTTDGTWNGITLNRTCAAATAFGVPVYIDSNGKAAKANAAAASTMPAIGLVVVAAASPDDPCTILTHGTITEDDWTWTAGNKIYVDDSAAGVLTATVGDVSGTDHVVQIMGIALSDDTVFVNPSLTTITLE